MKKIEFDTTRFPALVLNVPQEKKDFYKLGYQLGLNCFNFYLSHVDRSEEDWQNVFANMKDHINTQAQSKALQPAECEEVLHGYTEVFEIMKKDEESHKGRKFAW